MAHSSHHTPHEICFVLESVTDLRENGEVFLRVGRLQEEEENEWVRVLSPSFPLSEPLGSYYLLSLEEGAIVQELEIRIDLADKSYGAAIRLKGEVKTRGRVQLYNEIDPSQVILITVAVLIRILPLTPREYHEATTQTPATKRIDRLVQTEVERLNVSTLTSPVPEDSWKMKEENEEERRKEVAEIVEKTIKRRLMVDDLPSIDSRPKNLSEEVAEMRRSLRLLGNEERNRREKGEDPRKGAEAVPLTPPESPSTPSSSSSESSSSSMSDSKSSSSTSSTTETSSSSSSQESVRPKMSPTSAYIKNLRDKIIAERKDSLK